MEWILVTERLPENSKIVLGLNAKGTVFTTFYAKPHTVEYEDYDYEGGYDPIEDQNGCLYLKEGWYEECEQVNGEYDSCYVKRDIVYWMPIPTKPNNLKP